MPMSKEHMSQTESSQWPKLQQSEQENKVLDYNPKQKID